MGRWFSGVCQMKEGASVLPRSFACLTNASLRWFSGGPASWRGDFRADIHIRLKGFSGVHAEKGQVRASMLGSSFRDGSRVLPCIHAERVIWRFHALIWARPRSSFGVSSVGLLASWLTPTKGVRASMPGTLAVLRPESLSDSQHPRISGPGASVPP